MQCAVVTRRQMLGFATVAGALVAARGNSVAGAQGLRPTPNEILGPFYPVGGSAASITDLTAIPGRAGRAAGQVIHVMGRVINVQGQPVAGARVELWQANSGGRYRHPSDTHTAPLDPNFDGFGAQRTDAEGRYRFKTIKPGPYPARRGMRTPHLHFEVTGQVNRVITQMYFPGEPLNDQDFLLRTFPAKGSVIASIVPPTADLEPESRVVLWDIVLDKG